ncbi:MAG: DUF1501 domain-containing protein [Planctomycetota bacterium]|nr:DUF1501 domain-containing protein [Planctomycetota bacterium]
MSFFASSPRRDWLKTSACGFGYLALANLLQGARPVQAGPLAVKQPHFTPLAKRVIFVFLQGAPSHLDTFEYKPKLYEDDGKFETVTGGTGNPRKYLAPQWDFKQYGQSGHWFSDLIPNVAAHADKWTIIRTLRTDIPNHPQAVLQLHTGSHRFTRPSIGSWILYGLGTENQELPGFIAINPLARVGGVQNYSNAFLPAAFQATRIGSEGQDIATAKLNHITNPRLSGDIQRRQLDLLGGLNGGRDQRVVSEIDPQLNSIVDSYELAFRMQEAVPRLLDLSTETKETLDLYGVGSPITDNFARQCLLARKFSEAGVRFVEVCDPGWDHHTNLRSGMVERTSAIDRPVGALLTDLERRGLLKDTLVVFGGEFGRSATAQGTDGRDHSVHSFPILLAGAGVKPGLSYGVTDDYGVHCVDKKSHIYDLQATILHLLGLDHEQLTFEYGGRPFRLTDVFGNVLDEIVA